MEDLNDNLIVEITTDKGNVRCNVISIFDVGEKNYIALLPNEDDSGNSQQILLFKYNQISDEDIEILNIEDDSEYTKALERFDSLVVEED